MQGRESREGQEGDHAPHFFQEVALIHITTQTPRSKNGLSLKTYCITKKGLKMKDAPEPSLLR